MPISSQSQSPSHMLDPEFEPLMARFDLDALDDQDATIYAIDRELKIRYVNAGWFRFANANDAPTALTDEGTLLGASVLDFFHGPLRDYYASLFRHIFTLKRPHIHEYECSSPVQARDYHMDLLPLHDADGHAQGLLLINSLSHPTESTESRPSPEAPNIDDYINDEGFVVACSNCRRFRRSGTEDAWDWVPCFIDNPPTDVSHSLCSICLDFYYPTPRPADPDPTGPDPTDSE